MDTVYLDVRGSHIMDVVEMKIILKAKSTARESVLEMCLIVAIGMNKISADFSNSRIIEVFIDMGQRQDHLFCPVAQHLVSARFSTKVA